MKDLYLLIMVGDVEPCLDGPFATDEERLTAARNYRSEDGDLCDGLFRLDVPKGVPVAVDSFCGGVLDVLDEAA